jgi:hypothetical protein
MTKRHLHLDYSNSYCGKDISYLLATYDEAEADCSACLKRVPIVAKQRADETQRILDDEARQRREHQEDVARRAAEHAEAQRQRAEKEQKQREVEQGRLEAMIERAVHRMAQDQARQAEGGT